MHKSKLHTKVQERTSDTKNKVHNSTEKLANQSSDILHRGIEAVSGAAKKFSESVKRHLPD